MTCKHCDLNAGVYNMACIGCCARHIVMQWLPEGVKRIDYARDLAKKYHHDFEQIRQLVKMIRQK